MRRIEGVSERLTDCARAEFLDKGYQSTSIREIARKARTSPRAIYTRFADKEALFVSVVAPAADGLTTILEKAHEDYLAGRHPDRYDLSCAQGYRDIMKYVCAHRDELFLVVFCSAGTRYETFLDDLAARNFRHTEQAIEDLPRDIVEGDPTAPTLLQRSLTKSFYVCLFEPIANGLDEEQALNFAEGLYGFFTCGIKGMLGEDVLK